MKPTQNLLSPAFLLLFLAFCSAPVQARVLDGNDKATVLVESRKGSALIMINVINHRKIGEVTLELRNSAGVLLYREQGRAMTNELVRRLDKGLFPKGDHTLTVTAKDFAITQVFAVE